MHDEYCVPFHVKGNWQGEAAVLQKRDMMSSSVKSRGVTGEIKDFFSIY